MAKQDDWVRLTVRLPQEVYERLTETVASGPNSMNAEIVTRLENSFATTDAPTGGVLTDPSHTAENTLYILLDTNGVPISWQEVLTHLSEINKSGKLKFYSQNARILTSNHLSSSERDEQDIALFMKYRRLNKNKLSKAALQFLNEYEERQFVDTSQNEMESSSNSMTATEVANNSLSVEAIEAELAQLLGRSLPDADAVGGRAVVKPEKRLSTLVERLRALVDTLGDEAAKKPTRMPSIDDLPSEKAPIRNEPGAVQGASRAAKPSRRRAEGDR